MTHALRRHIRAGIAVLGVGALVVAIVAITTAKTDAHGPTLPPDDRIVTLETHGDITTQTIIPGSPQSLEQCTTTEITDADGGVKTTRECDGDGTVTTTQMPGPQQPESWEMTRINERTGYPDLVEYWESFPSFSRVTEISFPDTVDRYQALKDAWETRDRSAGFQPDYFVWYSYKVATNATVRFEGVNPLSFVNCGEIDFHSVGGSEYAGLISADRFFVGFLGGARGWSEYGIQDAASGIARVCGPYRVTRYEHQFTVYAIPQEQVYYGDTLMFHPETRKVVSFLDWLWETTNTYEQMLEHLQWIGVQAINDLHNRQRVRAMDDRAYALAGVMLEDLKK